MSEQNPAGDSGPSTKPGTPEGASADERLVASTVDLTADQALAFLQRTDVTAEALALLGRNAGALKSRKLALALAMHQRTPRHIAIPLLRRMFTFDLMRVTLAPAVAADIKRAAEEQILVRLESLSVGEKISLARRASGRVAAALLGDADPRVISPALDNSRLVEGSVVTALMKHDAAKTLFEIVSEHPKWAQRREVQIALLRSEKTPLERARELAKHFAKEFLREIVPDARRAALVKPDQPRANDSTY
jgi:hypothetical protein